MSLIEAKSLSSVELEITLANPFRELMESVSRICETRIHGNSITDQATAGNVGVKHRLRTNVGRVHIKVP